MPVISAYSTSGSSYISPSSYRYKSSLTDRSYTTSTSSSSSIYRRSSYRYDLPSSSSIYSSSYRTTAADRRAETDLSTSLSTVNVSKNSVEGISSGANSTVNNKDTISTSRPSRYSTAYSYSTLSSAPTRDYSSRLSSRSSDTRFKDRDNNCLCTGSSSYVSNLRSTALSGAELYQKYSVSTYKPNSFERISSRSPSETLKASSILKSTSPSSSADISKVKNIPGKDKNSNIDAVVVAANSNNNYPTNTNHGTTTSVANNPLLETNSKLTAANNTGAKPASAACFLSVRSDNSTSYNSVTAATVTTSTTTTTTITTTTSSSTSVLLSSSSSSSVLHDSTKTTATTTSNVALEAATRIVRKPVPAPAAHQFRSTLTKLRPQRPPLPKSAFNSSSNDLSPAGRRKEPLGLSSYRNHNFLKHECDLVKRELSKSATEITFKKESAGNNSPGLGSANNLLEAPAKLDVNKIKQFLPPVPTAPKAGHQPKDHEDDDKNHLHHHIHETLQNRNNNRNNNQSTAGISSSPLPPSAVQFGVELLKPIDRPSTTSIFDCTQKNDTSLFKPSPSSSTSTTTTTTSTTSPQPSTTESLTTASSRSSTCCTVNRTYTTNSRSATTDTMKSLHYTSEIEEPVAQVTIKLRPALNGSNGLANGGAGGPILATASTTTDDIHDGDHHVTTTIRIKPKSSISHSTTSSSSSSTNGSTNSINNNNNHGANDDHEILNGSSSRHGSKNNLNNNNNNSQPSVINGCEEKEQKDGRINGALSSDSSSGDDNDVDSEETAAVASAASVDKEPKSNDDDRVSYLRTGTVSKSIHSTSPVGYRSRDYDSGLGSYRSGLSSSSSVQKSIYDRTTNDDSNDARSSGNRKEGLCGLWNIGNTCFMNSIIQCLSHTRELTNYLRQQPTTERGPSKDHKILAEYTKLIKDMWSGTTRSVNPSELKYAFSSKHRMYSGSAQQDAQEFLRFFIDSLHSALNVSVKREPIDRSIEDDDMKNSVKAKMMWDWYSRVENSMIKDLFVGLLRSTLKCTYCNGASVTFDPFWDLSLPLPPTNSRCKLDDCMDMFVKEEVMDGIDQPTCSRCKTRRKCTKSLTIERFPKYLVIHLKRFSETRWSNKLTNVVEFPTGERGLNLQSYASEDNRGPVYYSLYGISNHMGSTAGGHYVAVCKHPVTKEWNEFNDNFVSETSERSLVTSSAYVLFYERA